MKIEIALIELFAALLLFFIGLYFYRTKDTEKSILFLSGDYSGLDTKRICRHAGKSMMLSAVPFLIGIVIAVCNPLLSIKLAVTISTVLLLFYIIDMGINRNKRYKL